MRTITLTGVAIAALFFVPVVTAHAGAIETSDEKFTTDVLDASESVTVIVVFKANWCGPDCKLMLGEFNRAATRKEHVGKFKFVTLDIDSSPDTARDYKVSAIPLTLVFRKRQVIMVRQGGTRGTVDELLRQI